MQFRSVRIAVIFRSKLNTLIPFCDVVKHVPSWVPGAGFKQVATEYLQTNLDQTDLPFEFTMREMVCPTGVLFIYVF